MQEVMRKTITQISWMATMRALSFPSPSVFFRQADDFAKIVLGANAVLAGTVFVLRSDIAWNFLPQEMGVAPALPAGDNFSRDSKLTSGNAYTKRYWPNCVAVAKSISLARSPTAHRSAPYWRENSRPESHQTVVKPDISARP